MFTGTFPRTLDDKLRVALPKRLREAGAPTHFFVTPGTDHCLALHTEESLAETARRLAQSSPNRQDVRAYQRLFYARAQRADLDAQGRLRIEAELAALAGLEKDVVLLGVHDHLELWSAARWQQYQADKQAHFDEIAETAFDLPS